MASLDIGVWLWVWNLAPRPNEDRKTLLRFFYDEVVTIVSGQKYQGEEADVFASLFPGESESLTTREIAFIFNCTQETVQSLGRLGLIKVSRAGRRGPTGATLFERESVFDFLRARIVY